MFIATHYLKAEEDVEENSHPLRVIAQAIIRRVREEHPGCSHEEFRLHLEKANPFRSIGKSLGLIWEEEVRFALFADVASMN